MINGRKRPPFHLGDGNLSSDNAPFLILSNVKPVNALVLNFIYNPTILFNK